MGQNLRHAFRSELIKQRHKGVLASRDTVKRNKGGKMAQYSRITSDNSYKDHWARAQRFAEWLKVNTSIRKMNEISPETASEYLKAQRDAGFSASTIGADALAINHLMIGAGIWQENQRLIKSKISGMPKRSVVHQQYKQLDSQEWRARNSEMYSKYQNQIDTIRAFGLRRRELVGGTSLRGRDGIGPKTLFRGSDGLLRAQVIGKGGKLRFAEVRKDMQPEMERLFGRYARSMDLAAKSSRQYRAMIRSNRPFFASFAHRVPTHIFRADYAQNKLQELNERHYQGYHLVKKYRRAGLDKNGKQLYKPYLKRLNDADEYQIGAYKASYGAFFALSENMGHNRLDVLNAYLGIGR